MSLGLQERREVLGERKEREESMLTNDGRRKKRYKREKRSRRVEMTIGNV
jgi:hypothetical protein